MGARRSKGGVKLAEVVPTALQAVNFGLGHVRHELLHFGVLAEKVFDVVGAVFGTQVLVLAVHGAAQGAQQHVLCVARKERVPVTAPQHLDDVPTRTVEQRFQLLNDLPIAAHRAVQTLQIAVDDEAQVAEVFPCGQCQTCNRFGLVHLTVTKHAPDMSSVSLFGQRQQTARLQIAHETRLVHSVQGPQAHRTRGELPKVGHQHRVRVRTQPRAGATFQLLSIVSQLRFAQAAFQKCA